MKRGVTVMAYDELFNWDNDSQSGSCSTFPSVPSSWSRGSKVEHFLPAAHPVWREDRVISLKCKSRLSVGGTLDLGPKSRLFKVYAFKGGNRHDDTSSRANGSKSTNVKISILQHENEESCLKLSKVENVVPVPSRTTDEPSNGFRNWLMLLPAPSQIQPAKKAKADLSCVEQSQMPNMASKPEKGEMFKTVLGQFLSLNATMKIPLLIFAPLYLAVSIAYGSEASKELAPLWILGPLAVALYIKMFQVICRIYSFSFKQAANVVQNLLGYISLLREYIIHGKLKQAVQTHPRPHLVDAKGMGYQEVALLRMKDLQGWLVERYLDFIESIWPYYCRTIRLMKAANLI